MEQANELITIRRDDFKEMVASSAAFQVAVMKILGNISITKEDSWISSEEACVLVGLDPCRSSDLASLRYMARSGKIKARKRGERLWEYSEASCLAYRLNKEAG